MRTKLFTTVLALTLTACGDDGGGSQDTGTTGPGTTGDDTTSGDPSATLTSDESSTAATVDPGTSSSGGDATSTGVDSTGGTAADESGTTEAVAFALFSDAFEDGGMMPGIHHSGGGNQSPPLNWEGVPAGTMSFAIFFRDIDFNNFEHSAIWNISADLTELPQDVDHDAMPADVPGALQCRNWQGDFGYGGPGSPANHYEFTLYAIDVAMIPEIDENSDLPDVRVAFEDHSIASVTLIGQSSGP